MSRIKSSVARLLVCATISVMLGWVTAPTDAAITSMSPPNKSTLTGASQLFSWTGSANITEYRLNVGSSLGTKDIHDSGSLGPSISTTVSGLPTNGNTFYVRLWQFDGENWVHTDFTYTAFTDATGGGLSSVTAGNGLSGAPVWDQLLPASMRFVLVMGRAGVLDKETGLVWEQSPQTTTQQWTTARLACASRRIAGRNGWRLPSVNELGSLIDTSNANPSLPTDHPFSNVWPSRYWSASTSADLPTLAWNAHFGTGEVASYLKSSFLFVWCVRGGGPLSEY